MTMAFNIEFRKAEAAARNVTSDQNAIADICSLIARAIITEREECAKIASAFFDQPNLPRYVFAGHGAGMAIAAAIRARGKA